jgi:hypothetical protein
MVTMKKSQKKTFGGRIPDFYERRWNNNGVIGISCKESEKNVNYLNYLRQEYEYWALWIDQFYVGENGIFNTIKGDAPRYALEDRMEFCDWKKTYKENYKKRDHLSNHIIRSFDTIELLKKLFQEASNYVPVGEDDEDPRDFLSFEEIQKNMKADPTYKEKWFQAAYDANNYIFRKLMRKKDKKKHLNAQGV